MSARTIAKMTKLGLATLGLTLASAAVIPFFGHGSSAMAADPPAATAGAPTDDASVARIKKGRELFANWGCSSCHALKDADADGHVGPAFDGNKGLTEAFITDRVTNGQGPMPAFGGQLTDKEIADLAFYIDKVHAQ